MLNIAYTLTHHDESVKCLLAFGTSALWYATEILATIEWGMQHWKMEEPFPVPPIPKWLSMPGLTQTTMPLRGELPLPSPVIHLRDIHFWGPTLWAWIAVLLQYWQDHISVPLYSGRVRKASELTKVLIRNINPWLPHRSRFSWDYVINHTTLWLDIRKQFVKEHFQEWEAQKTHPYQLGPLEHDTELAYHRRLTRRQAEMDTMDSREEEAKKLLLECQMVREEQKLQATPVRMDMCPAAMESSLYPNWKHKQDTKPKGIDKLRPYKMPKEEAKGKLTLEEELDTKSVFNPLVPSSQSSKAPNLQLRYKLSPGSDATGPKTPPHFCEGPISIPPYEVSILGIPNKSAALLPIMDHENNLLNLAPGLPVKGVGLSGIGCGIGRGSGLSSGTGSPMSIGLPVGTSLGVTLKIRARVSTPAQFEDKQSSSEEEEDMDATTESTQDPEL